MSEIRPAPQFTTETILDFLHGVEALRAVPRSELEWLVRQSELVQYEKGLLYQPGAQTDFMLVILEGGVESYTLQSGQRKVQMGVGPGDITGLLPFSRMKLSPVFVEITEPVTALLLKKSKFHDMIAENYELAEVLVHTLVDRARHFTGLHFQNEKLMSLGKLSAGLAHELNNPAGAILRSAEDLKQTGGTLVDDFDAIATIQLTVSERAAIRPILEKVDGGTPIRRPLLERKRLEEEMTDWLNDHHVNGDCAESFVDSGLTTGDLETLRERVSADQFLPVVHRLAQNLESKKAIREIATAARRISELVQSVKSYTRMDQVHDMQEVRINEGIHNSVTMLEYKARQNSVLIHEDLAEPLPAIHGFPGELNQVWTNIIDNAIDAMKKTGGELTVRTFGESDCVIFTSIDTGPGIPAEDLERIFDPFFTTKDVGEGTGVGLDLVRKVVAVHKGKIDVSSQPGRTEFRVSFPHLSATT